MLGPLGADHPLRRAHPCLFNESEGAGYWIWKPQIILDALERSAPDDIVVYVDSGARLRRPLAPLITLVCRLDAVLFANDHANVPYTKRDAYVLTGTDSVECHATTQLDAALMIWRNTAKSRRLVSDWLQACCDARALTDDPNVCGQPDLPSFRAHRHDQALLSLIVWRDRPNYALAVLPRRAKFRFLEHHRRRARWMPVALWHATHDGPWERRRAVDRRRAVAERRALGFRKRATGDPCAMERLSDLSLYSSVDRCLSFLRALPASPVLALPSSPEPVHFYWDGSVFGAKPALCLRSFLATQDSARVRPWLWLADRRLWEEREGNVHLAPLLPHIDVNRFDLTALAEGTPLEPGDWSKGIKPAFASDLARLVCTFHHGGCYSDLDALFLRNLGPLFALAGNRELCFQWSSSRKGTNAFCRHAKSSDILRNLMIRAHAARSGHARHLFSFDSGPAEMLMLPVAAFSPIWLVVDGHDQSAFAPFSQFDEFFAPRSPDDPRRATLDTFFPGAFTYHWHGRWTAPESTSSWAGQLAGAIQERLMTRFPAVGGGPRYGT
jgi:hypothetical protein